ncbi:MAG: FAD-binding oxidoreductase [Rhizobiales bacterium]|nr:FAD-binding oxidoreductase [Hyphomicrobiales bacterium]
MRSQAQDTVLERLAGIVGAANLLTAEADLQPYVTEWRGYYRGRALAVAKPRSAAEVAAILRVANETGTPIVPQGGNTGLVGGQTPDESGREVVLSLERLDRIRAIDPSGATIVAEAGVILERLHEAASEAGMLFPLALGAQGSCRIGGNISTNAGGTAVLAYGNTRNLVLGLEVVLPTGEIWDGLRSLLKDNTGYDLKQLFIGAEGTLGIVTAAVLKLFPKPRGVAVAFAAVPTPQAALALFRIARGRAGAGLTAFELMPRVAIEMALRHLPEAVCPLPNWHAWFVLLEFSSATSEEDAQEMAEAALAEAYSAAIVTDAALASSSQQGRALWRMRHSLSEAQKPEGASIKHDVSVPVERVPEFLDRAMAAVASAVPGIRPVPFGHLGDGNIHFNLSQPVGADPDAFLARAPEIHAIVHGIVVEMGGSVSAEHGIGRYKRELLKTVKSGIELDLMRRIKKAFDPNGILNPGRVL